MWPTVGVAKKEVLFGQNPSPLVPVCPYLADPPPPDLGHPLWMPLNESERNRIDSLKILSVVGLSVGGCQVCRFWAKLWPRQSRKMEQNWFKVSFRRRLALDVPSFITNMDAQIKMPSDCVSLLVQLTQPKWQKSACKEAKIIGPQQRPDIPETVDFFGYTCKYSKLVHDYPHHFH